jgi:hypothetical protein
VTDQAISSPPKGLTPRSRAIWRAVLKDFDLVSHEKALLEEALRALDRADQARAEVDEGGLTYRDRFGQPRPHPALAVERDNRGLFARTLRELGLDANSIENRPPAPPGRYDA